MDIKVGKEKIKNNIRELIEQGEMSEALTLISDYENIFIDDVEVFSMTAVIAIRQGLLYQAEEIISEGLLIDKNNFDLNYNLAYIYQELNDFKQAIHYYKIAQCNCLDDDSKQELEEYIKKLAAQYDIELQCNKEPVIRKILFIQSIPDIRTNKIAFALKICGIQVDVMYFMMHPQQAYQGMQLPYENIYRITEIKETIDFINNSDYDIVFSCNEPDYLSAFLLCINKPLIHDCHDMMSLRGDISNEEVIIEYLANCKCDGNIYVTDLVENIARQKFELDDKPVMLLDNYILKTQLPKKRFEKLSKSDGEIHCVYEGGLTNVDGNHRNIEHIFLSLANENIHVHYYTAFDHPYFIELATRSPYLHYEGTKEPNDLIEEMTKYDIGLTVLNVTENNKLFLNSTFPNKAWEYLAAELPILFSDLQSFRNFVEKYRVGEIIDTTGSLKEQMIRVKEIKIKKEFLLDNGLYMENFSEKIISFLQEVQKNKNTKKITLTDKSL